MFRSLLSCASIFVLLVSTLISPESALARRCGVQMPVTLLQLYRESQFIYVGTFDRVEEGEAAEDTADYTVIPIKKFFSLSTSLKGETKKMLVLEQSEYRFKDKPVVEEASSETENDSPGEPESVAEPQESEPEVTIEAEAEDAEVDVDDNQLNPGDRVLLFLNKDEDSDELDLADYSDGMKKMTAEKLSAYEPRIRELNEIFSKEEPSYSEIVAWLVRCAEDPLTRWEGTYELQRSFQYMDWKAERAKQAVQKTDAQEEETIEYLPREPKKFETGDENFAKELTEGQKLLLTNMLLNRERPKPRNVFTSEDTAGMNRGDRELIELVKRWGDSKVAINILEQLRYDSSDANLNTDLMSSIASILDDADLGEIAAQYSTIQWKDDDDEAEAEPAEASDENDQAVAEESADGVVSVQAEDSAETATPAAGENEVENSDDAAAPQKNEPKKKTYAEAKAELIKRFLDRADRVLAEKEKRTPR